MSEKKPISVSKIFLPVFIGLGVVGYLFYDEFDATAFEKITFTWKSMLFIFCALLLMFGRDFGYMLRLRILSEGSISWRKCFRIIMLWEFTSAVTPGAIGGTSLAILYINKEGTPIGKSTSIVMATSVLDELYFIIMFPLMWLLIPDGKLFFSESVSIDQLKYFALIGYFIKLAWVLFLSYGMFIKPYTFKWILVKLFSLRILKRWQVSVAKAGDDIIESSQELKYKSWKFWLKSLATTFLSWTSRYWVVNVLFLAFFMVSDHFLIFARQLVMWIMMLIMPTPGGSGLSEMVFSKYLNDFIPIAGFTVVLAFMWRIITYYIYLIIGAIILPRWLRDHFATPKIVKNRRIKNSPSYKSKKV